MKVQEKIIDNRKVIQIYLTANEKEEKDIQEKIKELQAKNSVSIFVSGGAEVEKVLNNMVKIMKSEL